jgi:WD40 repeat protein
MRVLTSLSLGFLLAAVLLVEAVPAADNAALPGVLGTFKGHTEAVYGITFSPDGKFLVTGSGDRSVRVWDAASGKELKAFAGAAGHQNLVLSVAVSPDGSLIASGGSDNTAKIWDFPAPTAVRTLAKTEGATAVAVSPDGTRLAAGNKDGSVHIWNIADGKELFVMTGHAGAVTNVGWNNNGQLLASSGSDSTVRFWNTTNGQLVAAFAAHRGAVNSISFNPGANVFASAGTDGVLKYWNVPPVGSRPFAAAHGDIVTALALAPDNNTVASGCADKTVRLATVNNGQTLRTLAGAASPIESVAVSFNGTLVAAGTADRRAHFWQLSDGKPISDLLAHNGAVKVAVFHPGTGQLLTGGGDGLLRLWNMPPLPAQALNHPDAVHAAALFPDAKRVVTGGADKVLRVWTLPATDKPERQLTGHPGAIDAVAVAPDGKSLASAGEDGVIRLWDLAKGQQAAALGAHSGPVTSLAYAGSGQVLSTSADGSVKLWQPPTAPSTLFAHSGEVTAAVLSPDGNKLLTGSADRQVRVWSFGNGQLERALTGPTLGIISVAYALSSTQVAGASADKTVRVWDAAGGKELKSFTLAAPAAAIAFTPDSKVLVAGLADGSIHLLDIATGKETKAFAGHTGAIAAALFTSKGDLVTAGADKAVRLWSIMDGKAKQTLDHGAAVQALAISRDGVSLASGAADKTVKVWTVADGKLTATVPTPAAVQGVALAPDGKRVVTAGADGRARVFDLAGNLQELVVHDGPVQAVAWHPDGKRLASASSDKTARGWAISFLWQGQHPGGARQAVFARGDRVVSTGADGTIKMWAVADGKLLRTQAAHEGGGTALAFSNEGRILSAGADKTLKIWALDVPAGKEDKPVHLPLAAPAQSVAFTPDGKRLAAAVPGEKVTSVRVFDSATGRELQVFEGHTAAVRGLQFLPDGRMLLSAGVEKVVRLSDANATLVIDAHAGGVLSAAYVPNGSQMISSGADRTVKIWGPATGQLVKALDPLPEPAVSVAVNRAGSQFAAAAGKLINVWNVGDLKLARTLTSPAAVSGISFSADSQRLAAACADNRVRVWEVASGQELVGFLHNGPVRAVLCPGNNELVLSGSADKTVAVHTMGLQRYMVNGAALRRVTPLPSGSHFVTGDDTGKVKLWNMAGAAQRTIADSVKPATALAASKNSLLLAAGGADSVIRLYTPNDGKLVITLKAPAAVRTLAFTPDSQALLALCEGGALQGWNVVFQPGQQPPPEFGKPAQSYAGGAALDLAFGPTPGPFWTAGDTGPIQMWRYAGDTPTKNFPHPNLVDCVAFSPDGTQLATGCHDGRLRIFDIPKATQVRDIAAHAMPMPASIYCLAWTVDGKRLITGSYDRSVKLWNAADGKMIAEIKGHEEKKSEKGHLDGVYCLALSSDGKLLATGGGDKAIKLWSTVDGTFVRDMSNPAIKSPPVPGMGAPLVLAHPSYIYGVRFTPDNRYLVSIGGAQQNRGFLALWSVADGKLLMSEETAAGTLFALCMSTDGKLLALGTGGTSRPGGPEMNHAYIIPLPTPK